MQVNEIQSIEIFTFQKQVILQIHTKKKIYSNVFLQYFLVYIIVPTKNGIGIS